MHPFAPATRPHALWFAGTLALIAVQGLLRLYDPFDGDQALFLVGARALDAGGRLYVEFWDNKQPGIYWFYWLAGRLFGFTQEGVRACEILWVLALAAVLMAWLSRALDRPWLAAAAALAACNGYFALARSWDLGQLEILVCLPAALSAWLLSAGLKVKRSHSRTAAFVAAGVCGGIAAVFKLVLAPIFAAMAIAATLLAPAPAPRLARLLRGVVAYGLGAQVPLLAVALVFAGQGALAPLLEVAFVYPLEALAEVPKAPLNRLIMSFAWIAAALAPWLPFSVLGAVLGARRAAATGERAAPVAILALVWLASGLAVILVQKFSWWVYQMWLVAVPAGVLAALGLERLCTRLGGPGGAASAPPALPALSAPPALPALSALPALVVVVAASATALPMIERIGSLARHATAAGVDVAAYRRGQSATYAHIADSVALLAADDRAPIYVFGSPLYYLLSGRAQAIPIHGWAWGSMPERIWRQLPVMLDAARPGRIFLAFESETLLRSQHPLLAALLDRDYRRERTDALGGWLVRIPEPAGR